MKSCTKCKQEKPISEFGKNKHAKDGLRIWCKNCYNEYARKCYANNKEPIKKRSRLYFSENRETQNAKRRDRRRKNIEQEREVGRIWAQANKDKTRAYKNKSRAKRINAKAQGKVSGQDIRKLLANGQCFYCGVKSKLTLDHVVPLARGGSHSLGNLVAACGKCNSSKGAKLLVEWKIYLAKVEA